MRYTVWSHGREIGETDLGFIRCSKDFRAGWFHPNAAGEQLMPIIDAIWPAIFACTGRKPLGTIERDPELHSQAFSTAAEALARAEGLGLQLRRDDGTVVPTSSIAIRGCPSDPSLEEDELTDWISEDDLGEAELFDALADLARFHDSGECRTPDASDPEESSVLTAWAEAPADDVSDDSALERYQIHVLLEDDDVIP